MPLPGFQFYQRKRCSFFSEILILGLLFVLFYGIGSFFECISCYHSKFKMPQEASVNSNEIVRVLSELNIFKDSDGNLKSRDDEVWKAASKALNMKKETINLYAKIDRNNILTDIKKNCGIEEVQDKDKTLDSTFTSTNDSDFCIDEPLKSIGLPSLFFSVDIEDEEWIKIAPTIKSREEKDRTRQYKELQPEWTDSVAMGISNKTKLPCAFSFKNAKISDGESNIWLKIKGVCNECGNQLKAIVLMNQKKMMGFSYKSPRQTQEV